MLHKMGSRKVCHCFFPDTSIRKASLPFGGLWADKATAIFWACCIFLWVQSAFLAISLLLKTKLSQSFNRIWGLAVAFWILCLMSGIDSVMKWIAKRAYSLREEGSMFIYFLKASTSLPWRRRQWHPTLVLLPGESRGWRSLDGCGPCGRWGSDKTERLYFQFSLSCIGEGNGNPLQCSFLENPRDRGAWWAAIYGVTQSRTRLKWLSSSSSSSLPWKTAMFLSCPCYASFTFSKLTGFTVFVISTKQVIIWSCLLLSIKFAW